MDLLESMWSPALSISKLLAGLQNLLMDPTPDESCWSDNELMKDVSHLCESNRGLYDQMARKCTQRAAARARRPAVQSGVRTYTGCTVRSATVYYRSTYHIDPQYNTRTL